MINTENESSLHNTLKLYYSAMYKGQTEIKENGFIYDVVCDDNLIIEIQTKNLSSLYKKITSILNSNKKLILVHPVVIEKQIILYDKDRNIISKRKSSSKGDLLDLFSELTKIYPLLLHPNFTLEVLEISLIEERMRTLEKEQSKNNRRRFKKNWQKINKRLNQILVTHKLTTQNDYYTLLPKDLPKEFSSKELKECLIKENKPKKICKNPNLIIWVLSKMGLIKQTCIKNRFHYYTKTF